MPAVVNVRARPAPAPSPSEPLYALLKNGGAFALNAKFLLQISSEFHKTILNQSVIFRF